MVERKTPSVHGPFAGADPWLATVHPTCTELPDCQTAGVPVTVTARSGRAGGSITIGEPVAPELLPSSEPSSTESRASATTSTNAGVGPAGSGTERLRVQLPPGGTGVPWMNEPSSTSPESKVASVER